MNFIPERGDIYHIDVPKSEICQHEFYGPHWYVVLSPRDLNDALKTFTAVPLTSPKNKQGEQKDSGDFRWFRIRTSSREKKPDHGQAAVIFNGDSIALPEALRTFSLVRLTAPRAGVVEEIGLGKIEAGILFTIGAGIQRQTLALQQLGPSGISPPQPVLPEEPARPQPGKPPAAK